MPTDQNPQVSIIIPSYNTAHLIAACLDSVFAQTYRGFEAIVVNDGSPDTPQLEEVLRPYQDKIVYIRQQNKRVAGARNTAIRQSRGELLAFLDSDDTWLPHHLASQMQMFEQDPQLDLVYSDGVVVSDFAPEVSWMKRCPSRGEATFEALVLERCQVSVSTVVVRKAALVKAGLFDESLMRCDDYDMWLRTAFFGAKIGYHTNSQVRFYLGRPDSLGQSRVRMAEAYCGILEKAAKNLPLNPKQRELVLGRATEVKARYLVEEGKLQLRQGQPEKARELFAEANRLKPQLKVSIMIHTLQFAPWSAGSLVAAWSRLRPARKV